MYITTKIVWKTLWHGFLLLLYYSQSLWSCIFFEEHKKIPKIAGARIFFIFFRWHMLMFIGVFWLGFFKRDFYGREMIFFCLHIICGTYELFIYLYKYKEEIVYSAVSVRTPAKALPFITQKKSLRPGHLHLHIRTKTIYLSLYINH